MAFLTPQQRNTLEAAVKKGRKAAESGAFNALQNMAVNSHEYFPHMDAAQRLLRNSLRSKGRLLGDDLPSSGPQKMEHLTYELAYETWHKMLFAKFLEANNLLMHPDGVAVTMADCEELAADEGFADKWEAAANYASRMLPLIFRPDDPLMQVPFALNDRLKLEEIIGGLDESIFTADDALGWVYQFWQSEAKDRINKSGDKIDGEKLPAVTQLFTEPYMVHFLIDNTLGAWWMSRNPGVKPPMKFEYLRLLEDGTPAAGKFEGWPDKTAAVTTLDPCMGSGHFVASLFTVLATLRMHEEGLTKEEATDKVIAENLHGLELDPRCTQIAAFNLALTAWKFCGQYKELPEMNLACSGIAPKGKKEDWLKLVRKESDAKRIQELEYGMAQLYDHFQLAPELGSLIDPTTIKADAFTANFKDLQPVLKKALQNEQDTELHERGVMAAGIAKAGELLARKYELLITNVPYLARGKQDESLATYILENYPDAKGDLATVFISRMQKTTKSSGVVCCVMPQNWLFMINYKGFRVNLLQNFTWNFVVRLGSGAFSQISGEVVKAILCAFTNSKPLKTHSLLGIDVSNEVNVQDKSFKLRSSAFSILSQSNQLKNPDSKFIIENVEGGANTSLLQTKMNCYQGVKTGDDNRLKFLFWEISSIIDWKLTYGGPLSGSNNGCHYILNWKKNGNDFARFQGQKAFKEKGFYLTNVGKIQIGSFNAKPFTSEITVIVPKEDIDSGAILSFLLSNEYEKELRKIDQNLAISTSSVGKVPFDLTYWQTIANENFSNGLSKPYSGDPTQWLFHGHPIKADNPLQVALARLLGYRWPAEKDTEMELADEGRGLINVVKAFDHLSDEDGIFCIPSVNGEQSGTDRLREYLQVVFAGEWNTQTIAVLLQKEGATSLNLEGWLRNEFFIQHCKVFQNRPFIWHIWDGRKDGFSALVNYHKLDKDALSNLIYTYLGDWIRQCEAKVRDGESGAEGLLSAAQKLKEKLELILQGEKPYDIFVRWKHLEQQSIGWEPDLNDGVRLNIRPFMEADVLRKKPNIKWEKDRGKNPPGSPWGEERINDKHLSLEEKRKARENVTPFNSK